MQKPPIIWVLADEAPGHRNQSIGVARALGGDGFIIKSLEYTKLAGLPNALKGASLLGLTDQPRAEISPPWPDIVIGAGRRTAPVARYIKKKSGGKSFTVQLMWPGTARGFDLIAVPEHDGIKPGKNIMTTLGAPNHLTRISLVEAMGTWQRKFADLPSPRIALLVGGSVGKQEFTVTHGARLAYLASRMAGQAGGSLMVTLSRRTPKDAVDRLKKSIACPYYWFDATHGVANPYLGILGSADAVIVTGDSVSMCSEACYTGKPVFIYAPNDLLPDKHMEFVEALVNGGYASLMLESELVPEKWQGREGRRLDEAGKVAEEIRMRFIKQ